MITDADRATIERFQNLEISTPSFGHREHVEIAFLMLGIYDFVEATARYARTIRSMAAKHGAPEKYNATITFAFMSLVAERRSMSPNVSVTEFLDRHTDLLNPSILSRWYSEARLRSPAARSHFLLPDMPGGTA